MMYTAVSGLFADLEKWEIPGQLEGLVESLAVFLMKQNLTNFLLYMCKI